MTLDYVLRSTKCAENYKEYSEDEHQMFKTQGAPVAHSEPSSDSLRCALT